MDFDRRVSARVSARVAIAIVLLGALLLTDPLNTAAQARPTSSPSAALQSPGNDSYRKCWGNVGTISAALVMFQQRHKHFPRKLSDLVPHYLMAIPTCPGAGRDTYSRSYRRGSRLIEGRRTEVRLLYCSGRNHSDAGVGRDEPKLNGFVDDPCVR